MNAPANDRSSAVNPIHIDAQKLETWDICRPHFRDDSSRPMLFLRIPRMARATKPARLRGQ
jgi:hypothetical protein